jgi:hypothetical protein
MRTQTHSQQYLAVLRLFDHTGTLCACNAKSALWADYEGSRNQKKYIPIQTKHNSCRACQNLTSQNPSAPSAMLQVARKVRILKLTLYVPYQDGQNLSIRTAGSQTTTPGDLLSQHLPMQIMTIFKPLSFHAGPRKFNIASQDGPDCRSQLALTKCCVPSQIFAAVYHLVHLRMAPKIQLAFLISLCHSDAELNLFFGSQR